MAVLLNAAIYNFQGFYSVIKFNAITIYFTAFPAINKREKEECLCLVQTVGREANSAQSCDDEIVAISDAALPC